MTSPSIGELPLSPPGRKGWPWTEPSAPLPATLPDGRPWPKISIVTPSFKQGRFIEETIRSVLLQGYPNLEYIIIDGGSKDEPVEIIRKYERWLTYWVSEPDRGQSEAINKGMARATGEILAYINSDDYYAAGAFKAAVENLDASQAAWFCADVSVFEEYSGKSYKLRLAPAILDGTYLPFRAYPSVFGFLDGPPVGPLRPL